MSRIPSSKRRATTRAARGRQAAGGEKYNPARRAVTAAVVTAVPPPPGVDPLREWYQQGRLKWTPEQRAHEARRAIRLVGGRAWHLADRFPPLWLRDGRGGVFGHGDRMESVLAVSLLYQLVVHENPTVVPDRSHLEWVAELADTGAVDVAFTEFDRAARRVLVDDDYPALYRRIEAALEAGGHWPASVERRGLAAEYRRATKEPYGYLGGYPQTRGVQVPGALQVLDAVLVSTAGGYSPGVEVQVRTGPHAGKAATVVQVEWAETGPPVGYQVALGHAADLPSRVTVAAGDVELPDR